MTGLVVIIVLVAAAMLSGLSTSVAHASVGRVQIASANSVPRPTAVTFPSNNESVIAGTDEVVNIDGAALSLPGVFAISFAGMSFSGAQFSLFMSTNGFAEIESTDVPYGPTFSIADFTNTTDAWKPLAGSLGLGLNGTFYIGTTESGVRMVAGPIAMDINNSYDYIKIFQGSSSPVVVAGGSVAAQPGIATIQLNSSSGAPGTSVKVTGGGFSGGTAVDINATYEAAPWIGANMTHNITWIAGISAGNGYFTTAAKPMVDAGQVINPKAAGPYTMVPILLFAVTANDQSQVLNAYQKGLGSPVFREFSRGIDSVTSYSSSGQAVDITDGAYAPGYLYGNDSGTTGTVGSITVRDMPTINAEVFGVLHIAGSYFDVGQPMTFWVGPSPSDAIEMNTSALVIPDSTGSWNANVTVPVLSGGPHTVWIENNGVDYAMSSDAPGTTTTTRTNAATATTTTSSVASMSTTGQATTSASSATPTGHTATTTHQSSTAGDHSTSTSLTSNLTPMPTSSATSTGVAVWPEYLAVGVTAAVLLLVVSFLFFRGKRPVNGRTQQ